MQAAQETRSLSCSTMDRMEARVTLVRMRLWMILVVLHVGVRMPDAQAQSSANPQTLALANAVLDAMDWDNRYDRLLPRFQIANDAVADAAAQAMFTFNKKYLGPNQLRPLFAETYATLFTEQELHDLVTWYGSPLGRKLEATLPALIAMAQPSARRVAPEQELDLADPERLALANAVLDAMDVARNHDRRIARETVAIDATADPTSTLNTKFDGPRRLRMLIAGVYARMFSEQELRDLVPWYASPLGRKLEATRHVLAAAAKPLIENVYREHSAELREAMMPGVPDRP